MATTHHHKLSSSSHFPSLLDALYCEEEEHQWEELEEEEQQQQREMCGGGLSLLPILLIEHDLFEEDEDLLSLFSKEQSIDGSVLQSSSSLALGRKEAVKWMLKVNSYYGFSTLTAVLSINYLDRFLSRSSYLHHDNNPWTIQLVAVACISLAAKVEEVDVPLLLDLQVEGAEYMFQAKSIQKMEVLILSTLEWKMHPVTPISFLDHIIRRLGLKIHLQWEFLRQCEQLLVSVIADSRVTSYLPSILGTAIMLHVIDQIESYNPIDYHDKLMSVLNINKEQVKNCYELLKCSVISDKRKSDPNYDVPTSPNGVMDSYYFSSDSSSDTRTLGSSTSSSVSSSPDRRAIKRKKRVHEQYMPLRVNVDAIGRT